VKTREARIFTALFISVTLCAIILMALGKNPPSAGAFSLDDYFQLQPVEKSIASQIPQYPERWNSIRIFYKKIQKPENTSASNISRPRPNELNCHFYICKGFYGADGQISATEYWNKQLSIKAEAIYKNERPIISSPEKTIHICLLTDNGRRYPMDYQAKRLEKLVGILCRNFDITRQSVHFPELHR